MLLWVFIFAGATAFCAAAFMAVAVMWLRKLRVTVSTAMHDSADRQVLSAQKLGDAIVQLQKQQRAYEQQLHSLAQASLKLRQELTSVAHRLEQGEPDSRDRTVH